MSLNSEMNIIMDDFMDDLTFKDDDDSKIEQGCDKSYYIGRGEFISKQLREDKLNYPDNYFHFLSSFLRDFKDLPEDKKIFLKETMCIEEKVKIVEKKVIVNQKTKNNNTPTLNMGHSKLSYDDY
jgi:hypothetical protein